MKFGEAAIFVAGAIVTYSIITKIAGTHADIGQGAVCRCQCSFAKRGFFTVLAKATGRLPFFVTR